MDPSADGDGASGGRSHHARPVRTQWDPRRCRPDPAGGWTVRHVAATGSTNDDLVAAAAQRAARDGTVLVADLQSAGRGRLGRAWQAPARAALTFSMLLRSRAVPPAAWGWVGALLGLAVVDGIALRTGLAPELKWPNDVLVDERKVAGVLAAAAGSDLVVGAGINLTLTTGELPRPDATSLRLAGSDPDLLGREELLAAVLDAFAPRWDRFCAARGDADASGVRVDYLARCATVGRAVTVHLPAADAVLGTAVDISPSGALVVDDGHSRRMFTAADVVHLRGGWHRPSLR